MSIGTVKKRAVKKGTASPSAKAGRFSSAVEPVTDKELIKMVPGALAASFVRSKLHEKELEIAGLSAPSDWEGEMPELPSDIAAEDHSSLANLMADFVNALSTATWHQSKSYIEHHAYEQIAEYLLSIALLGANESNEQKRTAAAKTSDDYIAASSLAADAYRKYVRFRDVAATLKLKHATVSRVGGFVGGEVETEATGFSGRSVRGKDRGSARGSARGSIKRSPRK